MNICVNARDAMPTGGKLTIETSNVVLDHSYLSAHPEAHAGDHVLLAVADTGCGMDAADQGRASSSRFLPPRDQNRAQGLALATVFGIVKQSAGHVEVYSEPGLGTAFKVYLPRDREGAVTAAADPEIKPAARGSETVLLAEDEDGVRALARLVLRDSGYTVLEARNGAEAVRVCQQHKGTIDILVTDVVMPNMSGSQAAERLLAVRPRMKVLYLSGYTDDAIVRHGVLHADVAFLQKPFTPIALAQKVREVLDRKADH